MQCPACHHENVSTARFCGQCGGALSDTASRCSCGTANPRANTFCHECGRRLDAGGSDASGRSVPTGERRQLTVVFCDLVDSTGLARRLGPEALREAVHTYQETCGDVVRRFDGYVAQYLGDGLLIYFGYPRAHEDDPRRAVNAALEILAELPRMNARLHQQLPRLGDQSLRVRIAIHTGPVVISELGSRDKREELALGDTLNIAARLQGMAGPGQILLSEDTHRLVHGFFETESLGMGSLRGIPDPIPIYRALRPTGVRSRFEVEAEAGLTPFVGREQEIGLLLDHWARAKGGVGQVVLLSGDPGIGKSRVVRVLHDRLAQEPHTWLEGGCSPYHQNSAFHPVIGLLEEMLLLRSPESPEGRIEQLEEALASTGADLAETLPLLAGLLSLALPPRYPPLSLSPEEMRHKTLQSLVAWFISITERQPVVLVMEDLQWMDPSSLQLLGMLFEKIPAAPALLLLTFREGFEPPWESRLRPMHLRLHALTRKQTETMVGEITSGKPLPALVREQLVAKTDGVPLFVEELTKSVLESDLLVESDQRYERTDPVPPLAIPATLQDSLMARLDRLGPAKQVAQIASALGREFPRWLLAGVSGMEDAALEDALQELVRAELVYQRGAPPRTTCTFKHALIRDTAYQSMLASRRRAHHRKIARLLAGTMPQGAHDQPEVVAHHFSEAGDAEQAAEWWKRAGGKALNTAAASEAERFYELGVRAVRDLPEAPERLALELELQTGRGAAMNGSRGWGNPDVRPVWERVQELGRSIDSLPAVVVGSFGLATHLTARGQVAEVIPFADQSLEMAERIGDDDLVVHSLSSMMFPRIFAGRLTEALDLGARAVPLLAGDEAPRHSIGVWIHSEVAVPAYLAMANALAGRLDESVLCAERAIDQVQRAGDPNNLAMALILGGAWARAHRREWAEALAVSERTVEVADRYDLPLWTGVGNLVRGSMLTLHEGSPAGIEAAKEGLGLVGATGMQLGAPLMLRLIAEGELRLGRTSAALETAAGALALAEATGQHFEDSYLHGVRGRALRSRDRDAAEAAFQQGLEIARSQSARSPELHLATELGRLWRDQGRNSEARRLVAPVLEWFSEGLGSPLVRNAKAMLNGLS